MCSAGGIRRPVQIEEFKTAIGEMTKEELTRLEQEIENSISHLNRSNSRLQRYIAKLQGTHAGGDEEESEELDMEKVEDGDLQLYQESLRENDILLKNSVERLEALRQEDLYRSSHSGTPEV
ncbi:hypothetical protein HG535_0D01610 [Zygotorulaspora mrakii]|uniref:Uncharacterized protein n=1 Tax=Zygotorulaspora mrakii TaxID=42260 RepID=A0A7H9B1T1_ZYGMR|nr:uncharacterized protein HG535_0D01610 [Zygotorulaspora mrakii]QLG72453.1 hypothetical protein HG535_0D01610 [Zygotorulaspora mrakii]